MVIADCDCIYQLYFWLKNRKHFNKVRIGIVSDRDSLYNQKFNTISLRMKKLKLSCYPIPKRKLSLFVNVVGTVIYYVTA